MSKSIFTDNNKFLAKTKYSHLPKESLPTMYDLPSEEIGDSGMPDEFHFVQCQLLKQTFQPANYPKEEIYSAIDMNLYFDENHTNWYKRPDWFGVVGESQFYAKEDLKHSYVIWQEEVVPIIVVEILSPSTEKDDLGRSVRGSNEPPTKWEVYEQILEIPYYVTYSHVTNQIRAFRLEDSKYIPFLPDSQGRYFIPDIELSLGLWYGKYERATCFWLRWFDKQGNLIVIPEELHEKELAKKQQELMQKDQELVQKDQELMQKDQELVQKDQELMQKDQELVQKDREKEALAKQLEILNAKLKEMGINPDALK